MSKMMLPVLFQATLVSVFKPKFRKYKELKSRNNMAVSMRDLDPAFQGAGQKAYP